MEGWGSFDDRTEGMADRCRVLLLLLLLLALHSAADARASDKCVQHSEIYLFFLPNEDLSLFLL